MRREHGPVVPVLLEGGVPAWCVLGYRELHHVTSTPELFGRDSRRWNAWSSVPRDWSMRPYVEHQPTVLFAEGEAHRERADAIASALSAVDEFELRSQVERICDDLIDGFAGRGSADLITEYAHRIPLLTMLKIYGLPDEEAPALAHDVTTSAAEGDEAVHAHRRTFGRMLELVRDKRRNPGRDVPSALQAHPVGLTDEEIATDLLITMAAGYLNTGCWMGNTIRLMLTDDRFAMTLSGGRSSVAQALTEVLWEDSPTQNFVGRWATQDTQLGGQRIRRGDLIVLGLASANTDPQVRPDSCAGAAGNQAHLSFSHGEHGCPFPAQEIARIIATTGIEVLLDRLPDVALAVRPDDLQWLPSVWVRGLAALPVTFAQY
ncbi:cytochrome P450 [Saccharopolyspora indica]|nr:cytochrome P450 [Saccharopolyspora indica]MDA3644274.1 cytochrome P450 [Saccharopolyspora indica]